VNLKKEQAMKNLVRTGMLLAGAGLMGGCAIGEEMGWHHNHAPATDVQVASCDASTATLKGKPDHDRANHACLEGKVRQQLTD
jgi:hypothetical protein